MEVFVVYLDNAGLPPNTELSKSEQTCLNLRHLNKPRRSEPKRPGANQRNLATPGRARLSAQPAQLLLRRRARAVVRR